MEEKGLSFETKQAQNFTLLLEKALNAESSIASLVVAQDGSGDYRTINEAVAALASGGKNRPKREIIYVKSGVYKEHVDIGMELTNLMIVGVYGDGFWVRGITFENMAGPKNKKQSRIQTNLSFVAVVSKLQYLETIALLPGGQWTPWITCYMITAQGRDTANGNSRISIIDS
ncbi:hypothetical protein ACH5RR_000346 [Cinchona calisaya]|uniref:Pectinesterase catalytic domain-containing protein n=1 Tax=Cinchona calisaya TaxID=153742 RepID=A0ABD3B0C9_9GENT